MNLNDLMEVWKSQDAAPLHGVNDTLLRLALRQDEARLQAEERLARRLTYLMSAFFVAVMSALLIMMIYPGDDDVLTGWDYAIPVVGAAAGVLWPAAMRMRYWAQARREHSFGASLRDQLNQYIAQLDDHASKYDSLAFHLANNLPAMTWAVALFFAILRINERPLSDAWTDPRFSIAFIGMLLFCIISMAGTFWTARRTVKRQLLPHTRRLEALLKELDDQE
jgi:hypothetical protein